MSRVEHIAVALLSLGKAAEAVELPEMVKAFPASRQYLMGIGLMSHVPDDLILRQIQRKVQRHGQLHRSEIGAQMTSRNADLADQEISYFLRKLAIVLPPYLLDIVRLLNGLQQHSLSLSYLYLRRWTSV